MSNLIVVARSEIVHIQAGQCGNQIGAKFWEVRARAFYVARAAIREFGWRPRGDLATRCVTRAR